jgi:hypothetical protein
MERFILKMKLRKKFDLTTVENCGYFIKMVIRTGTIVQGYCHVIESGEKLRYYWVEDSNGTRYDVAFEMAAFSRPEVRNLMYTLVTEEPTPGTYQTDAKNDEMFKLYKEDSKKFWAKINV